MSDLPQEWMWATISDVTQDVPSVKPDNEYGDEFGYIDISSIDNSSYRIKEVKKIPTDQRTIAGASSRPDK